MKTKRRRRPAAPLGVLLTIVALSANATAAPAEKKATHRLLYVGSSTVANFIRDAESAYGRAEFVLDTELESAGGEAAILEGRADLAGVARKPAPETLRSGVEATLIGRDAIAVIVNPGNPIDGLTRRQLMEIFTGKLNNWNELGGADLPIRPFIVGPASATRKIFRSVILGAAEYRNHESLRGADREMIEKVAGEPAAIGHLSVSFLPENGKVKVCAVEGQRPSAGNVNYPIARPLYLLWWPGRTRVAQFISWTRTPRARQILLKRFALAPGMEDDGRPGDRK